MLFDRKAAPAPETELPEGLALRVEAVSKRFKDFYALQNVSFDVAQGECVGIVGFNGAGKSTLLQIIADTLQPTKGSVQTRGRVVAMLELGSGFNPEYTGIENLYMNAALLGVPSKTIEQKLDEILAFAEIGEHVRQPVKTYSSGMVVRLAFALLTQIDPDIMIIDEALSVGDSYFAHKCSRLIKKYRDAGKTFLFVSHNDAAIKSLCDRAILLDKGALLRDGRPADILDYYGAMIAHKEREEEIRQIEKELGRVVTRSGNGRVKIDRFELMNAANEPRRRFLIGATARISCVVEAYEAVPAPTIGFMIRDRFGNDVYGTNTYHLKQPSPSLVPGQQTEAIFETQLHIGPGEYSLTLAAHDGPVHLDNNYDWFDRLILFQVLPDSERFFSGVAALPCSVALSNQVSPINRHYTLGETIDFADTGNSHRHRVEGWHKPEHTHTWTKGRAAALHFTIPESPGDLELSLDLDPFVCPTLTTQIVTLVLNGATLAEYELDSRRSLKLPIPRRLVQPQMRFELHLPRASSPAAQGLSADPREIAVALRSLTLAVAAS